MTDVEEIIASLSPNTSGNSDPDEFTDSGLASLSGTAAIRVSIALHRHNSQLLREKQEMETKHNEEIFELRRQIVELQGRISRLIASAAKQESLNEQVRSLTEEKSKVEAQLAECGKTAKINDKLEKESAALKEEVRRLQEENKQKETQLRDLKFSLASVRDELSEKIDEIMSLKELASLDSKDDEIERLKATLAARDEQIVELQNERDSYNVHMEAIKDVQLAHEDLRKSCQDKDRHIQNLEEVLGLTIREKEHISGLILKLQEDVHDKANELEKESKSFSEFKRNAERQYEDTCQQYVAKLNALHMTSYGAEDYPGKADNVTQTEEVSSVLDDYTNNCTASFCDSFNNLRSPVKIKPIHLLDHSNGTHLDLLVNEASRTIEVLRSEYDIEIKRNAKLQKEIDRLSAERDRLRVELHGETLNGSVSSWNCVLLTRSGEWQCDSSNEALPSQLSRELCCVREELQKCISERDAAKDNLLRASAEFERLSEDNCGLRERMDRYEKDISALRAENSQGRKFRYDYAVATSRCKALIYQKNYLQKELMKLRHLLHDQCSRGNLNGVVKTYNSNLDASGCRVHSCRGRFRVAGLAVIAIFKMTRRAERKRAHESFVLQK